MNCWNSSIDSGTGSSDWLEVVLAEAAAVWGGVGACDSTAGEAMACFRAGTSLGSSVEVAMSSRREVAASSLPGSSAIQHDATVNASLHIGQFFTS